MDDLMGNESSCERVDCSYSGNVIIPRGTLKPHTKYINAAGNKITEIPQEVQILEQLRVLLISQNRISSLPTEMANLKHLEEIDLEQNCLNGFPTVLLNCTKLKLIALGSNDIRTMPDLTPWQNLLSLDCFAARLSSFHRIRLPQLRDLRLNFNSLSSLPSDCIQAPQLTSLNLAFNDLSEIDVGLIAQCPQLVALDLRHNQIDHLTSSASSGPMCENRLSALFLTHNRMTSLEAEGGATLLGAKLTRLFAGHNQLTSLPLRFTQTCPALQCLILSNNHITQLPSLLALPLTRLDVCDNALGALPELPTSLRFLNASGNRLVCVDGLSELTSLQEALLSHNQLTRLPDIAFLTELNRLELNCNQIAELPPTFAQVPRLHTLHLAWNRLTAFPPHLQHLTCLEELNLSHNAIETLPEWIGALSTLRTLVLTGNRVARLPGELPIGLSRLHLSSNRLTQLPESLACLPRLSILTLNGNDLASLPVRFPAKLVRLELANNRLGPALPSSMAGLDHLRFLDLSHNCLEALLPPQAQFPQRLQYLDVSFNPLNYRDGQPPITTTGGNDHLRVKDMCCSVEVCVGAPYYRYAHKGPKMRMAAPPVSSGLSTRCLASILTVAGCAESGGQRTSMEDGVVFCPCPGVDLDRALQDMNFEALHTAFSRPPEHLLGFEPLPSTHTPAQHTLRACGLYVVIDGHKGPGACDFVASRFVGTFVRCAQIAFSSHTSHQTHDALLASVLRSTYAQLNKDMSTSVTDGCVCVCALVTPTKIYVANLGDSRAVLVGVGASESCPPPTPHFSSPAPLPPHTHPCPTTHTHAHTHVFSCVALGNDNSHSCNGRRHGDE
eukprot:gnl/Trimastix_PCT/2571.p1 GENE.gnl/Trimastix_PCT/2571~~gnl/Trimastix_PCT/2571.p1  ORF type:complete len:840 (+),score=124.44 gnl/Trimastix_PCT/2571:42-2561(+)